MGAEGTSESVQAYTSFLDILSELKQKYCQLNLS